MDSERFDELVRSLGQTRSRRQTLRGLAGAGALVALLAAQPVAAGKRGKGHPGNGQPGQPGNSPPGNGQNGPLGSGQNGSPGPSSDCQDQCQEQFEGCLNPCAGISDPLARNACVTRCATQQSSCLAGCPTE